MSVLCWGNVEKLKLTQRQLYVFTCMNITPRISGKLRSVAEQFVRLHALVISHQVFLENENSILLILA
jgi:hypothetical protein